MNVTSVMFEARAVMLVAVYSVLALVGCSQPTSTPSTTQTKAFALPNRPRVFPVSKQLLSPPVS